MQTMAELQVDDRARHKQPQRFCYVVVSLNVTVPWRPVRQVIDSVC